MNSQQWLGTAMLLVFFAAAFALTVHNDGLRGAIFSWVFAGLSTLLILVAVQLLQA